MAKTTRKTVKKTPEKKPPKKAFNPLKLFAGLFSSQIATLRNRVLSIMLLIGSLVGIYYGFQYLEKYVLEISHERKIELEVVLKDRHDKWEWVSNDLVRDILLSAEVKSDDYLLDKDLSVKWARNLAKHSWIQRINSVRKQYDGKVIVDCEIRQPIAKVKESGNYLYLDADGQVMAPVYAERNGRQVQVDPVYDHLVEIKGSMKKLPKPGEGLVADDIKSGLAIISVIRKVDALQPNPNDRVLKEFAVCDVSNYKDRVDRSQPRIKLFTQNKTEVRWGAEVGNEISEFEQPVEGKLARLYQTFRKYQTLDTYMFVELRNLRNDRTDPLREG